RSIAEPGLWPGSEPAVFDDGAGLAQPAEHDRSVTFAERKLVDGEPAADRKPERLAGFFIGLRFEQEVIATCSAKEPRYAGLLSACTAKGKC
ncbi:MAG: hypothetical protein ABW172_09995, partial [Candidatus Binatia bacterium]